MAFDAVLGQSRAIDALKSALKSGSVHHAWLFGGPEGVGKELTAVLFAQALTCPIRSDEGCTSCASCRRVQSRNHPDVTWVLPEDEAVARGWAARADFDHTPSREIRVEQIRSLQERLAYRPLESKRKVAVLLSAQAMNQAAQNAFLKTLEEPPADTVLVLVASSPDKLLPTIRSRCAKAHFGPLPSALIAERVKAARQVEDATAHLLAMLGAGSLSRALALDVDGLERRREIVERFESLGGDARAWLQFAEDYGGSREEAERCLAILSLWTRDLLAIRAGSDDIANRDLRERAAQAAAAATDGALHRRQLLIAEAANAVTSRHGSPRLQLERMLVELHGSLAKSGGAR